ncbi:uncharacterized protein LOC124355268 [Homalodisca vitripennis]|nr:uncharacterized protein LOC124355268 [Homalodisca vitripennis]
MRTSLYITVLVSVAALAAGITTEERPTHAQSRRIQAAPGPNHFYSGRQANRRVRPSLPAPPYAVQMEPLVQYSQRDPLYHQRQDLANITSHNSIEEKVLRVDHDQEGTNLNEAYGHPSDFHNYQQHYYREPEPIIEIIIKESNETLPAPPPPPVLPVKPTKEPVHVFYVKYKKNPKGKGEDDIIYEAPIPAITPPSDEVEHDSSPQVSDTVYESASVAPPPSTTLRTIIHPDSEFYHGSSLKVTFGETEVKTPDAAYEETNSPEPSIALPHKEAQSRESNAHANVHTPIKRQGTYQTIPQEVYDQNPPKVASPPQSTFQSPVGKFQQNNFQQQNLQHVQFQQPQSQQQKVNFPRQAPINQQPAFRPQHTSALFNNQQQHHQQFNQRPQFQPQPSQIHQRQVPRQQSNPYSTIQSPTQNNQQQQSAQSAQFRVPSQQYDQRPSQYSQPLNNPQSQRQLLPSQDPQILHQQQIAQQQQIQQQQQQAAQGQFRNQPIKVTNQDFNRYNLQGFPTFQPQNTPIPLPSKPIHPLYAQHYHQQINLAQQQRQNFVPSTYQPQPQPQPQQGVQQQHQQHYRLPQQTVSIPQQPSTPKVQLYQHTTPRPQPSIVNKYQDNPIIPNLSDAQVIKSISQSEEHLLQPQYNQKTLLQNNQQTTIDQINQLNQLRNQQASQLNHQLLNQQINHQLYQQQQQQQTQQQFSNDFTNQQQYVPQNNQQRPAQYSHPNQLVSTTSQPVKSTSASYQTKYTQVYSHTPSTTPTPTEETPTTTTEDPEKEKEKQKKFKANLAALPDEVPDDIREQLLSSGILSNADISILDYDKIGDIPIENLPPEALENFYGAASAPVPAVVAPDSVPAASESEGVEMKVVRYDPSTKEGQDVEDAYIKEDATQVDSVILNDSKYNRYLPLKVSGSNFPLPDESVLAGRRVNSVVVLAPVDYDFVKQAEEEEQRTGRAAPVQVQGVRFIAGNILKNLIKDPTEQNYKSWLAKEKSIPADKQSVVLLVVSNSKKPEDKEIYMYDIGSEKLSRLRGELSTAFVEVAENNAKSQELDDLADVEGAASALHPVRVPPPASVREKQDTLETVKTEDLVMAASETDENIVYQAPTISSGYSKMAVQ